MGAAWGAIGVVGAATIGGLVSIYLDSRKANRKIDALVTSVAAVRHQVFPNGGGSLSDDVTQLRKAVDAQGLEQRARITEVREELAASSAERRDQIRRVHGRIDEVHQRIDGVMTTALTQRPGGTP